MAIRARGTFISHGREIKAFMSARVNLGGGGGRQPAWAPASEPGTHARPVITRGGGGGTSESTASSPLCRAVRLHRRHRVGFSATEHSMTSDGKNRRLLTELRIDVVAVVKEIKKRRSPQR